MVSPVMFLISVLMGRSMLWLPLSKRQVAGVDSMDITDVEPVLFSGTVSNSGVAAQ